MSDHRHSRAELLAAFVLGALLSPQTLAAKSLIPLEPCRIADLDGLVSTEARCGTSLGAGGPGRARRRDDTPRRRGRSRDLDQGEARPALPRRRRPGPGIDPRLRAAPFRLRRHPARARPRHGGPARHRRFQSPRLRHAGRRARGRRDLARGTAQAGKGLPAGAPRPRAVLHDEHRRARPRRGARGARLPAGERLRRLLRHAGRAALCAPLSGPRARGRAGRRRPAGNCAGAEHRHRVAARARPRVRALRVRPGMRPALSRARPAVRKARCPPLAGTGRGDARRPRHRREQRSSKSRARTS